MTLVMSVVHGQYRFINYDYTHGLSVNNITQIAEDSLGYLWLGSNNGLVRFDGIRFHHFESKENDSSTIYGSEVSDIAVAKDGKVWISFRDGGISVYDHKTQSFKSKYHTKRDGIDFPKFSILNLCIDSDLNKLWLVSPLEGIYEVDMETMESRQVISSRGYKDVYYDSSDPEYIYLCGHQLKKLNKRTFEEVHISDKMLMKMIKRGNKIYGYSWSEDTFIIDLETKKDQTFPTDNNINRGLFIHNNEMWTGNYSGIHIRDLQTETLTTIKINQENPFSIANHHITALFKDSKERIWIGTERGLSAIIPDYQKLTGFAPLIDERLTDIHPAEKLDEYYTFSFHDNSIKRINTQSQSITNIHPTPSSILRNPQKAIKSKNKTWVLFYNGLGYFTESEKKIVKYDGGDFNKIIQRKQVGDIEIDNDGYLWMARIRCNYIFKISSTDPSDIDTIQLPKIKEGQSIKVLHFDGLALWIGTDIGICRLDLNTHTKKWMTCENDHEDVFNNKIEAIKTDPKGNLWVLSLKRGAWKCRYNKDTQNITILNGYTQENGLPNNRPWSIDFDASGKVYIGSNPGLSVYNSENGRMVSLNKKYGFTRMSLFTKVIEDKLFLLTKGLSYYHINDLPLQRETPLVNIQSFAISNQNKIGGEILDISLTHKENDIAIEYIAVDICNGRDVSYRYRLSEDKQWIVVDYNQRNAIFNELTPGEYHFEVQAAGKNMIWGPSAALPFIISPPFWISWWFILLSIFSIAAVLYLIYRYRMNQVKHLSGLKTRMAELENEALRAQMNPHFIFNSLNSIKSFIINNRKEEAADYLTVFADLIRIVLSNSKKRFISLADEVEALDLYMEIENIRLEDKFSVVWKVNEDIDIHSIVIPPLTIQPFVENAIWHGFVHKKEKGNLIISMQREHDTLLITITDDGIGRAKSEEIEKKHPRKRSFGIDITEQRIDYGKVASEVIINDLFDAFDNPSGTEIILKMPLKLSSSLEKNPSL